MSPCHRETDGTGQQTFLGTYAFGRKFDTCKLKHQVAVRSFCTEFSLYRQECFTGKYTTRKIHTQLQNPKGGIALHPILFYGKDDPQKRKRRKKWFEFVQLKRAHWTPSKHSHVC